MRSSTFRKILIPASYTAIAMASFLDSTTPTPPPVLGALLAGVGAALFVLSAVMAWRIHSMFPKRHEKPEDFPRLLKDGPYRYCRHPFYLSLIINQASIPMIMHSAVGAILFIAALPAWYYLVRLEEAELVSYWGEEYLTYMREVPALIPLPRRASDKAEHVTD